MFYTLKKIFYLIKISNLKKSYYFIFFLTSVNFFLELLSLGSIIPLIAYIVDPQLIIDILKQNNYDFVIVEKISTLKKSDLTKILFLSLLIIFTIKTFYGLFYSWYLNNFAVLFERNLTKKCLNKYYDNFDLYFSKKKEDLFTSITFRTTRAGVSSIFLSHLIVESMLAVFILSFLIYNSSSLSLSIIFSIVFIFCIFVFFLNKKVKQYSLIRSINLQKKNNLIKDFLDGIREIIIFNSGKIFMDRYDMMNLRQLKPQRNIGILNTVPKIIFEGFVFLIILLIIYLSFQNNEDTNEIFIKLGILVTLLVRLLPSINRILLNFNSLRYCNEPLEKIYSDLNFRTNPTNKEYKFDRELELKNIDFSYGDVKIFDNLNLSIKKGEKILIIGDSGSGKSTLIDIIIGLLHPSKGQVVVDNKVLKKPNDWTQQISYVPQKTFLYNDTVKFNITFEDDEKMINKKFYEKSLKISGLDNVLKNNLYTDNTIVDLHNPNFSGGQKQRISIARSIYKEAQLIVLDEATNSLDDVSELMIISELLALKNITLIVVSHNKKLSEKFETVYNLKNLNIEKC